MLNGKKIIFAAGGTGGHINPALAVAGEVRRQYPDAKILFIGTAEKMEARLVPAAGYDFKTIQISGFNRVLNLNGIKQNIKTLSHLLKSSSQAKKIIREFEPDVVIGFGGYVSGLAHGLVSLINVIDPEVIVLGVSYRMVCAGGALCCRKRKYDS